MFIFQIVPFQYNSGSSNQLTQIMNVMKYKADHNQPYHTEEWNDDIHHLSTLVWWFTTSFILHGVVLSLIVTLRLSYGYEFVCFWIIRIIYSFHLISGFLHGKKSLIRWKELYLIHTDACCIMVSISYFGANTF